ncbi:MAG: dimethylarginine dimethylaminohydrolase family protein [Planctomycetota bacterium]|jgi:N-dimethylarginine dimethylaminohydrolase
MNPSGVLMCPPDHFEVVDVKNPHMQGHAGGIDHAAARTQWDALAATFARLGLAVHELEPRAGLEDMVFCANPSFAGPGKTCVLARMRHDARQPEVAAHAEWFARNGYRVEEAPCLFEGGGDAIWDPRGDRVWLGHGFRSAPDAAETLQRVFGAEVTLLELVDESYYHLDTCFCPLDETTVLLYPPAFADPAPVYDRFEEVLELGADEALCGCNAAACFGSDVVVDRRAERTIARLGRYRVHPVDTGEFVKSGGSVFCLKGFLYD